MGIKVRDARFLSVLAPICRKPAGSYMPETTWLLYAENAPAPLCRKVIGSYVPEDDTWTTPGLFRQWWVPRSSGAALLSCEQDVRVGGCYRLVFEHPNATAPTAFFGTYLEVVPHTHLVWTNEESADGHVTTLIFEHNKGKTELVMRELYPSNEALDIAIGSMDQAMTEIFMQSDEFLLARQGAHLKSGIRGSAVRG
ncbi:hypothetical protein GCM10027093_60180 [Paraburkholderia jirisanensis]